MKILEKKNKIEGVILSDIKTYYRASIIKTVVLVEDRYIGKTEEVVLNNTDY